MRRPHRIALAGLVLAPMIAASQSQSWLSTVPASLAPPPGAPVAEFAADTNRVKSVGTAMVISLSSTIVPMLLAYSDHSAVRGYLIGTGLLLGPSTGYWYAGSPKWKKGVIIRTIAGGVGAVGVGLAANCGYSESSSDCSIAGWLLILSSLTIVTSDIVDIARLPAAVRDMNDPSPRASLLPFVGSDGRSAGLAAQLRF